MTLIKLAEVDNDRQSVQDFDATFEERHIKKQKQIMNKRRKFDI